QQSPPRSMPHSGCDLTVVDIRIWRSLYAQYPKESALGANQRVVDQYVVAGHVQLEVGDHRAARRHRDGLNSLERRRLQAAQRRDRVEYFPDDMEGRVVVRTANAEENADGLAYLGMEGMQLRQRADRAVENEIFGVLVQKLLDAELRAAVLTIGQIGVDLALHHVELEIDRRQATFGLHQNESVHAVGDVLGDHRRGTVVDIEAGHQCLPGHRFFPPGIDLQRRRPAARPCRRGNRRSGSSNYRPNSSDGCRWCRRRALL